MKAYFSRKVPFYVLAPEEVTDSLGFDAIQVETTEKVVKYAQKARAITIAMKKVFETGAAPEECAQQEVDKLKELING